MEKPKNLILILKNFQKFKDKIEYIVVDKIPEGIEKVHPGDKLEIKNKKILDNSLKERIIKEINFARFKRMFMMKI